MSFQNAVPVLIVSYSSNTKREELNFNFKKKQSARPIWDSPTHNPRKKSDVLDLNTWPQY